MTIDEMTKSFDKLQKALIKHARNRYRIEQDPEDIVCNAYLSALNGKEYEKVPIGMARTWWYYKVSAKANVHIKDSVREAEAFRRYQLDPTVTETEHEDLSVSEGLEVLEGAGGVFVQVRTFCYNALQATHLEGRHDHRRDDQEF